METLRLMELLQRNADNPDVALVKPNTKTYCMAIDAFGISACQKAFLRKGKKHNIHSYATNISEEDSYLNDDDGDPYRDIDRAKSILQYMHDLNDYGNYDVIPNVIAYNTIITAYSRISSDQYPDAPTHAENVLRQMIDLSSKEGSKGVAPNTQSYNGVIKCWANSKQSNAGARSEWWLRRMWGDEDMHDAKPDVNTYNSVILAFLNIGQASQAESLLEELIAMEESGKQIMPNSETFSLVIRSWLRYANDPENDIVHGCHRAYKWLSALLKKEESGEDVTSSPELFSQIIKTIQAVEIQDKALLNIALKTFSKLKSSRHHVDIIAYNCLLQIGLQTLSDPSMSTFRKKFVDTIISNCCDDGLINRKFILTLSEKCSSSRSSNQERQEIMVICRHFFSDPIPLSWFRNVQDQSIPSRADCMKFLPQDSNQEIIYK